jgi:hypothetical protein
MGTGIALVSALRARVPVLLHDRSSEQVAKGLSLVDKLLAKDVAKGRLTNEEAKETRDKITVVGSELGIKGMRDVDMVIEVFCLLEYIFVSVSDDLNRLFQNPFPSSNPYLRHLQLNSDRTRFLRPTPVQSASPK